MRWFIFIVSNVLVLIVLFNTFYFKDTAFKDNMFMMSVKEGI